MRLTLSSEFVRNASFTNESGQVIYKTTHPHLNPSLGTTRMFKVKPNDDPMDMRDEFVVIGEIEWHVIGSSTFRLHGQNMKSNTFLPSHGILRRLVLSLLRAALALIDPFRKRTFTGPDGCPYRWDMMIDAVVVRITTGLLS